MPPYRWGRGGEVPHALEAPPDVVGCFSELGLGYGPWPPRCPCFITWAATLLGRSFAALWGVNCARSAVSRPPATGMVQVKMLSEGAKGLCHLLPTWLLHALFRVTGRPIC